jgi:hypothetical protein
MSLPPITEILVVQMGGICCGRTPCIIEEILAICRASDASSLLILLIFTDI